MTMTTHTPRASLLNADILASAIGDAFKKLSPRQMARNPVMFVVEILAALVTVLFIRDLAIGVNGLGFSFQIVLWLWFTVLFANFAEAVAEGRGKAQAASLRATRTQVVAKRLESQRLDSPREAVPALRRRGDRRHRLGE
jgi:K+-transporting ATPase ATPase B chain